MISLRKLTKNDLPFLLEVRNDKTTRTNLENDNIFTIDECISWFENLESDWYIIEKDTEKVGYLRTNSNEIGCDIHPKHRRKGYARLAYHEYLKNKNSASLWVFEDNFAKNLYESLGFLETGEYKIIRERKYVRMIYER
jgi:hypothetical protein